MALMGTWKELGNEASEALHRKFGFTEAGRF
jgi:L-amino acid N-acyltransferase YncA